MSHLLFSFLLAWLFHSLPPQDSDPPQEFKDGMEKVRALMDREQWSAAQRLLGELLEKHVDREYVHAARLDIEDSLATCVFRDSFKEPKFNELVSGELLSFNGSSGDIRIKYTPRHMEDFLKVSDSDRKSENSALIHPMTFSGPYTIELKGTDYPYVQSSRKPYILVCIDSRKCYCIQFGNKAESEGNSTRWAPPRILFCSGEDTEVVESRERSPVEGGKPFHLTVKVGRGDIGVWYNGKNFISTRRSETDFGMLGFGGIPFDEILISGKISPAWFDELLDVKRLKARAAFDKQYKPEEHLPAWLMAGYTDDETPLSVSLWEEGSPGKEKHAKKIEEFLKEDKFQEGLKYVRSIPTEEISGMARSFLAAAFLIRLQRLEDALKEFDLLCGDHPDFVEAFCIRASLWESLGQKDEAMTEFRRLMAEYPLQPLSYSGFASVLIRQGELSEAKQVVESALAHKLRSRSIDKVWRTLVSAEKGPDWKKIYDYKSRHYHVFSDINQKLCREAASDLEEALCSYFVHLERTTGPPAERYPVYLFSGWPGYCKYLTDLGMFDNRMSAGCYVPALKQLMIWNTPDQDSMMRTIRHEGFHQYLHSIAKDPPLWFDEGLAGYFEIAERRGGDWKWGGTHPDHVDALRVSGRKLIPLRDFLHVDARTFHENEALCYAQSWAFVHFLRHSTREYKKLFDGLFETVQEDLSSDEAIRRVFIDVDFNALERDFKAHVESLKCAEE